MPAKGRKGVETMQPARGGTRAMGAAIGTSGDDTILAVDGEDLMAGDGLEKDTDSKGSEVGIGEVEIKRVGVGASTRMEGGRSRLGTGADTTYVGIKGRPYTLADGTKTAAIRRDTGLGSNCEGAKDGLHAVDDGVDVANIKGATVRGVAVIDTSNGGAGLVGGEDGKRAGCVGILDTPIIEEGTDNMHAGNGVMQVEFQTTRRGVLDANNEVKKGTDVPMNVNAVCNSGRQVAEYMHASAKLQDGWKEADRSNKGLIDAKCTDVSCKGIDRPIEGSATST